MWLKDLLMKPNPTSLIILLTLLAGTLAGQPAAPVPFSITTGPYLQSPTETSMTVMWITNKDSVSWVEYGEGDALDKKAISSQDGLIDAGIRIHKIKLSGLKPGTQYGYRVYSKDIVDFAAYKVGFGATVSSAVHHFRTLDRNKEKFAFLTFTDIHENLEMVPQLMKVNGDRPYDLVVFLGDIISHIEGEQQIVDFINTTVEEFSSEIPFVWIRGNHETRGRFARLLPRYIDSPNHHYYFSFDHGPVHFTVLDAGEDKADSSIEYSGLVDFDAYRSRQAEWLAAEIKSDAFRQAAFRIGLCHMPFPQPTDEKWHGMRNAFVKFGPLFNEGKVDVLFSGHQHRYGIHDPVDGRNDYPIVQGGAWREGRRTLIRVKVSPEKLDVEIIRGDGEVVAAREIPTPTK
jgi:predicted phosphodiesterase